MKRLFTISGTGFLGYTGDGGLAINAIFGGNSNVYLDGPWSISVDEDCNIFVGDTQNYVVRLIDSQIKPSEQLQEIIMQEKEFVICLLYKF